jgi:hypothetical protein
MPPAPPDPKKFNVDAAANAVLAHINGTAVLPAADLAVGKEACCCALHEHEVYSKVT